MRNTPRNELFKYSFDVYSWRENVEKPQTLIFIFSSPFLYFSQPYDFLNSNISKEKLDVDCLYGWKDHRSHILIILSLLKSKNLFSVNVLKHKAVN